MSSINRLNTRNAVVTKADRLERDNWDQLGFDIVIELDDSDMAQVAGGHGGNFGEVLKR
jgi:hypothetical protein